MSIEDFLGKLNGVTSDGKGGWMACCPAHDVERMAGITKGN